ncbi:MAG: helix-turn-helix domain-containing protein [Patescibacteria group bacterium]
MIRINPYKKFNGIHIPEGITKVPISKLSHGAKICYGRLARYAGANGLCLPRIKTLAEEIGVKRRAVDSYIKELKDFGLIETQRRGLNKSNKYYFLDHSVLRDALTNALISADTDVADAPFGTNNKESHIKENQSKDSQLYINPDGLFIKSIPLSKAELGVKDKLEKDIKEIIMVYRYKVSKSYPPQMTATTTGLIKLALKNYTKEQLLEGIDRYSKHTWWMEHTAQHGIDWYFSNEDHLEDFQYLEEEIW